MSLSEPPEDPRARANLTPALAVRVGIVGSLVLALFAIVFFRLWFLQVLTGTHYVEAAAHNTTRNVAVAAPRGKILARDGAVLVSSTTALSVEIVPSELPVKVNQSNILTSYRRDDAVYDRLSHVIGMGRKRHPCKVATPPPGCDVASGKCPRSTTRDLSPIACTVAQQIALNTYADVTVKSPVSTRVQYWIDERANEYRGVDVAQTSVSGYPYKELAAQTLGNVGRLTTQEHHEKQFKHVNASAVVGQSGLEYEYDQYLRGTYGEQRVKVNADGVAVGVGRTKQPVAGEDLKTTLDLSVQQVGDAALQHSIDTNDGQGGAFVAMNPDTGAIYGMGSLPSYNPDIFTKPVIPTKEYDRIFGKASNDPQFNRATQSAAPTGSTFKVITATAAMESGKWSPDETFDDDGPICFGTYCPQNSGGAHYGVLDLASAIKVSDDEFFYNLGAKLNIDKPKGGALQSWAHRYGIGRNPDVDLPQASSGLLPTPAWFDAVGRQEALCETATGDWRYVNAQGDHSAKKLKGYHRNTPTPVSAVHPYGCGLATAGATWTIGQNVLSAVGQGNDEVSPLQLSLVYSAIANGGTIVHPHVGDSIVNAEGTVLQKLSFPAQRHLNINPEYLDTIRAGLNEAAQGGGATGDAGTSQTVMQNFGKPVYAKTGTAQYIPTSGPEKGVETDSSWYAAYVPRSATTKPIVVVVWVEGGGFGAIAAAPVARQIMSQWFYGKPGPWTPGDSQDQ
jgi:penicillin-binding protein 2